MNFVGLLFFIMALNMDALGVGISYGIRRIAIPVYSMLIVCAFSVTAISLSMGMGQVLAHTISAGMARHFGGGILLILGLSAVYQYYKSASSSNDISWEEKSVASDSEIVPLLELHIMGIIIQILKQPETVDMDRSGIISGKEAVLLGLALSVDSLGAGMAISLLGYPVIETALGVGMGQFLFMKLGIMGGKQLEQSGIVKSVAILPGLILILLGISRFY